MHKQRWYPTAKDLDELCKLSNAAIEERLKTEDTGSWKMVIPETAYVASKDGGVCEVNFTDYGDHIKWRYVTSVGRTKLNTCFKSKTRMQFFVRKEDAIFDPSITAYDQVIIR